MIRFVFSWVNRSGKNNFFSLNFIIWTKCYLSRDILASFEIDHSLVWDACHLMRSKLNESSSRRFVGDHGKHYRTLIIDWQNYFFRNGISIASQQRFIVANVFPSPYRMHNVLSVFWLLMCRQIYFTNHRDLVYDPCRMIEWMQMCVQNHIRWTTFFGQKLFQYELAKFMCDSLCVLYINQTNSNNKRCTFWL